MTSWASEKGSYASLILACSQNVWQRWEMISSVSSNLQEDQTKYLAKAGLMERGGPVARFMQSMRNSPSGELGRSELHERRKAKHTR